MVCEIFDVDSADSLSRLVNRLKSVKRFSFDTEYDCFRRYYGFTLFLLSIYDGESVYLIDAKRIDDFSELWKLMEDPLIQKVLYAGSEDLALLHSMGCNFRNLFDVQISAYFANHEARGLSDLIASETGRRLSKNSQLSDWSKRPLSHEQREYAANDVNTLFEIADKLYDRVLKMGLEGPLAEEFRCLEVISERDFSPKLKPNYYREKTAEYCRVLLLSYEWRDNYAKQFNVPPHFIVSNEVLEEFLFGAGLKYNNEPKGFHRKILKSEDALVELNEIRYSYDKMKSAMTPRNKPPVFQKLSRMEENERMDKMYNPVRDQIYHQYGEIAGAYILRNIKKHLVYGSSELGRLRNYQEKILADMLTRV